MADRDTHADAALAELRADRDRLLHALRAVEWEGTASHSYSENGCPYCGALKDEGHTAECLVGAALAPHNSR